MQGSREERTSELLHRLVRCTIADTHEEADGKSMARVHQRAFRYAVKIVGSRIAPRVVGDEASLVDAIKCKLAQNGRPQDALLFTELHQKLARQQSLQARYRLLRLLQQVGEDTCAISSAGEGSVGASVLLGGVDGLGGLRRVSASDSAFATSAAAGSTRVSMEVPRASTDRSHGTSSDMQIVRAPPKALAFQEFAAVERTDYEVCEAALVRDVVFCCQGIDGKYLKYDAAQDGYVVDAGAGVPRSARELLRCLGELGWLFRRVAAAVGKKLQHGARARATPPPASTLASAGSLAQALGSALQQELVDYYRLMAVLEAQVHNPPPPPDSDSPRQLVPAGGGEGHLTLRRLAVWLAEPLQRMRLLAVMVDAAAGNKGGALAAALHAHTMHGDPFARSLASRLTRQVCVPLFQMVGQWLFEGSLQDPHGEFFVVADASVPDEDLWWRRYRVLPKMLPPFISDELAAKILSTGKSVDFLRQCCKDQGWGEVSAAATAAAAAVGGLEYGHNSALEKSVTQVAYIVDKHVLSVLFHEFKFAEHCLAIKRYLLLGQGDFIQTLLDLVGGDLGERAGLVSAYKLSGGLEGAIRASNAQFDDMDVVRRLRVKMMPHSAGERGWDVFSLEYALGPPLSTVFTPAVMQNYLRAFNFLWRLKRVEYALSASWQIMKPNMMTALERKLGKELGRSWVDELRRCQTLRNEMNHFVTNLQYYMMFEVLEGSYTEFEREMAAATGLDELIAAHDQYLQKILQRALLEERSSVLSSKLISIFDLVLRFKGFSDRLCECAQDIANRRTMSALRAQQRTSAGQWGLTDADPSVSEGMDKTFALEMSGNLQSIAKEYSQHLNEFLELLPAQKHVDLRFLLFRLDFSEFYATQTVSTKL